MSIEYRAAVLHAAQTPLTVETVIADGLKRNDVLVRIKASAVNLQIPSRPNQRSRKVAWHNRIASSCFFRRPRMASFGSGPCQEMKVDPAPKLKLR